MMLHRHFEALKVKNKPQKGMNENNGEKMPVSAEAEQHQAEADEQPRRGRKRKIA